MMGPEVASALASVGGDLVGNLANQLFGEDAAKTAYKRQKKLLREQIPLMVEGAVEAGLHPLAAIGVNPATGPAAAVGGDFSGMGASLGRATEALLTPADKIAARAALLDLEQRQANVDLTKAQLAGAQKALLTQGSTPGVASRIPPFGKSDRLSSGGTELGRTGRGVTFTVPPGWSAQKLEDEFGDIMQEVGGLDRAWLAQIGQAQQLQFINPLDLYGGQSRFPGGRNYR